MLIGSCYIYGYGSETLNGSPTLDLRFAPVTIISNDLCTDRLGTYNAPGPNSGLFCAVGSRPHVDACAVSILLLYFPVHVHDQRLDIQIELKLADKHDKRS